MHPTAPTASFPLEQLRLAAFACGRLRRYSRKRTAQMCVLSAAPVIKIDCETRWSRQAQLEAARRHGLCRAMASPLQRGHIHQLYQHVRLRHGLAEVRRTWGVGIKALLAEPAYVLNGGEAVA